jgi:hypothetical protein
MEADHVRVVQAFLVSLFGSAKDVPPWEADGESVAALYEVWRAFAASATLRCLLTRDVPQVAVAHTQDLHDREAELPLLQQVRRACCALCEEDAFLSSLKRRSLRRWTSTRPRLSAWTRGWRVSG